MEDSQAIAIGFKYTVLPGKRSRRDVPVKSHSFGLFLSAGDINGAVGFYEEHELPFEYRHGWLSWNHFVEWGFECENGRRGMC